jgi:GT2 family glycosyltransferase/glycosyltransferase involved in cell wall biosynthesis
MKRRALQGMSSEEKEFSFLSEEEFDAAAYLDANPDVAEAVRAGLFKSALQHWRLYGRSEMQKGLRASVKPGKSEFREHDAPTAERFDEISPDLYTGFDEFAYLYMYPDVQADGLKHWLENGRFEGRIAPGTRPYCTRSRDYGKFESRSFGINFFGPLSAASGLGTAARGYLEAIRTTRLPFGASVVDVRLYDRDSRSLPANARLAPGHGLHRINIIHQNCDMLASMCRIYGREFLDDRFNIGIWVWELPALRSDWIGEFGALDEVWVPSTFCREAVATLSPVPVEVMPHVVQVEAEGPSLSRTHFGLPDDAFLFCYIFDVSSGMDRKNPIALLHAFKRAFGDNKNVHLLLKYHTAAADRAEATTLYRQAQASNIRLMPELLTNDEIVALKRVCDCFVSPHRSEGFGLNIAEMMYLRKPVIATGYSGNVDYTTEDNSYLIDYKLVQIDKDRGPYQRGYLWAEPSVEHLSHLMRYVYENQREASNKAANGAKAVRSQFSARAVAQRLATRLHDLGLANELPSFARQWGRSSHVAIRAPISYIKESPFKSRISSMQRKPVISVIVPVYNVPAGYLRKCIESVRNQRYPFWELCLCDDASTASETIELVEAYRGLDSRIKMRQLSNNRGIAGASNAAVEISSGEYLAFLDNDDELHSMALLRVAETINERGSVDVIYTDEDKINVEGEHVDDYCKPDWSPEHLESVMYMLHLLVVRKSVFIDIGGFRDAVTGAQDYDLALQLSREARVIYHIPEVLYHWRMIAGSAAAKVDAKPEALKSAYKALAEHVELKYGGNASVERGLLPGLFRVRHRVVGNPPVTLLITTDNRSIALPGRGAINLLENFVRSIRERTAYRNYRILIVDNANISEDQAKQFRKAGCRVVSYRDGATCFNFSRKANFGFRQVDTELLVLLNDDMEVTSEGWLDALLEYSQSPEIGVVGGRLTYPDGRIQHVGIVLGVNGSSAHVYHGFSGEVIGYNGFTHLVRNYSAVTGACMATRKSVIEECGGFDEAFAIDFNDTDFCLKAMAAGYRNVYTPFCELIHFEGLSVTRHTQNPAEVELFAARWQRTIARDPYYNPNLARDRIDFGLRDPLPVLLRKQEEPAAEQCPSAC